MNNIRNFCIIAHIDHGKSTLADRFLEITGTVDKRKMKAQYLDRLDLERERGITVKMAPVRMLWYPQESSEFILNLIDTPGHSDFSYEVSRALAAVEGAILLVDAAQGVQAQTLANLRAARKSGLALVGAVNKIDLFEKKEDIKNVISDMAKLLDVPEEDIYTVSAKTGKGVEELLGGVIKKIPLPKPKGADIPRALIFDSFYDSHKGVVVGVRVFDGEFKNGDEALLAAGDHRIKIKELGHFAPELRPTNNLQVSEIGYIATGIKDPEKIKIGDTIIGMSRVVGQVPRDVVLPGYEEPQPVMFVSFYPENSDDYENLGHSLKKLRLNDSSLVIDNDRNEVLGRGYKIGFLGKLHYEITAERLTEEFNIHTIQTFPSVLHKIKIKGDFRELIRPEDLPPDVDEIWEPQAKIEIILPVRFLSGFLAASQRFRIKELNTETAGDNVRLYGMIPLPELIADFDDSLKSITEGYGSFSYELADFKKSDVVRVDILVSGEIMPGMSRFLPRERHEEESRKMVKRLKKLLPRQQYSQAVQAASGGRIIAREDIPSLKKNMTGHLYGGDRTRKMKLWQKQKKGKKKLKERGGAKIDAKVFRELLKK